MMRLFRLEWQRCAFVALAFLIAGGWTSSYGQTTGLYVPNTASNNLGLFTVNSTTGAVTPGVVTGTGNNSPFEAVATPDNKIVYVAHTGGVVAGFLIASNGTATAVGTPFANVGGNAFGIAIDTSGKYVYVSNGSNNTIESFSINTTSGVLTSLGSTAAGGTSPRGMAVDASNHLYVALSSGGVAQFTINSNGTLTAGPVAVSAAGTNRLAINPAGTLLYATNNTSAGANGVVTGFTIGAGGALTAGAANVGVGADEVEGLVVSSNGGALFVADTTAGTIRSYTIGGGGALSFATAAAVTSPLGVTIDPSGKFLFASSNGGGSNVTEFTITGTTLSAPVAFSSGGITAGFLVSRPLPAALSTVPAASTWSLIFLGMLLAGSSALLYKRAYR
jgi:6-phosphogluconolactonase (cycloisomerase 2 family)